MYRRLMIVVDDDPVARAAVDQGLALAQSQDAEVLFFHVLPDDGAAMLTGDVMPTGLMALQDHEQHVKARAQTLLAEAAALAAQRSVRSHGAVGEGADPASCVARVARERDCDLIVVGSHGRTALQRLIHGSLAASLLPRTQIPMLVCKQQRHDAALQ